MSKSRLEKFLYALYSLDSSDLPNPLSRIEELYKCLVTGEEAPTFEPISRVEKYLMAILGGYDVDSLPNPLSRVEVLLYKLATGDDNLDDVKSFLSEHEELLAEIIRNGGVGGNIDIEYVLHTLSTGYNTLYNTAKKPVKSAILKGNTLVNLQEKGTWVISDNLAYYSPRHKASVLKTNTKYIIYFTNLPSTAITCYFDYDINKRKDILDNRYSIFTTGTNISRDYYIHIYTIAGSSFTTEELANCHVMIIEYQDGMENWDIPYFEGMQSVKMPVLKTVGKNLFDKNRVVPGRLDSGELGYTGNSTVTILEDGFKVISMVNYRGCVVEKIKINGSSNYYFSYNIDTLIDGFSVFFHFLDKDYKYIYQVVKLNDSTPVFSTPSNAVYVSIWFNTNLSTNIPITLRNIRLEEGDTATEYEPNKSNILTVNEDVTLRGIDDVKDELNLVTGELTQRIGEVVLDGSENWRADLFTAETGQLLRFHLAGVSNCKKNAKALCDKEKVMEFDHANEDYVRPSRNLIWIYRKDLTTTVEDLKQQLQANPYTIQYELATESVKTVDLSVVDQDGNNTELSTFDDLTHVTLSSEGLIPEAELEVATKNEEDLEDSSVYTTHTLSEEFNTLYNTAEKPVKSAILKGQTMVNYAQITSHNFDENRTPIQNLNKSLEKGKSYTIIMNIVSQTVTAGITTRFSKNNAEYMGIRNFNGVGLHKYLFTATTDFNQFAPYIDNGEYQAGLRAEYNRLMILEGDYTNVDIPYFEGMQSVKMPVLMTHTKNLFDGEIENGVFQMATNSTYPTNVNHNKYIRSKNLIRVIKNSTYTISSSVYVSSWYIAFLNSDGSYCDTPKVESSERNVVFTTPKDCVYIRFYTGTSDTSAKIQIENGSKVTEYTGDYKTNILTVNEEVTLRGIGDVRDELNCLTGEVVQRVGEIILNGVENWSRDGEFTNTYRFYLKINDIINRNWTTVICNPPFVKSNTFRSLDLRTEAHDLDTEHLTGWDFSRIILNISRERLSEFSVDALKTYIQKNPITVQYQLATEPVKTVDLSVVDQDGNNTKLSTFDDLTHVTLSSEGLIPEAELEVAEKVPEVAANMLGISREQEVINTATNEQSENVDSTMIATTEIYEELL